ncbi:MAG: NAD(P)-dependent glycerol-3-phosphate dehydrogenase, partial [Clostridia bacterium]|nr:NAD(P)-dependent glycerol-3-phosphate dehydrogenase [Clostridia bacterium]
SQIGDFRGPIISVTKGIEFQSGLTMSGILEELLPQCLPVALSGPSLATEVARGVPTAVVAASHSQKSAQLAQDIFHSPTFRVYTSSDILGVELGGALKNIIAIGAGICDGMGFGSNSKAALLTRAIVEIRRLGVAMGAEADTFSGLSGLGDLMVTCFSTLSRNHSVGERLGKGEKLNEILASMSAVAEGVPTSASAHALSERFQVETPIMNEIYAILHEGKEMKESLHALIDRSQKAE